MSNLVKRTVVPAMLGFALLAGCANYEVNTNRGNIPGHYIRYEIQESDRAVEAARAAGKDKTCPDEFKAAEAAKNKAYDVFRACHTEEGAALAKKATAQANALCPPLAPAPAPAPKPVPIPPAAPATKASLTIAPNSITKGEGATLSWSSQNASACDIQPGIGAVPPQGAMSITPGDSTAYTIVCRGAGGSADSSARIAVAAPHKLCSPTSIDIEFDTNKSDIKPKYHAELKAVADFLKEFPNAKGSIEGYTDNVGSAAYNMKLSLRRADSVRSYLIKKFGIAPERITAKGFGETKPAADNKTEAGRQKNRRIDANFNCSN